MDDSDEKKSANRETADIEVGRGRFTDDPRSFLRERAADLEHRLDLACVRAGRPRCQVRLLPVSKTVPAAVVRLAADLGFMSFGENKVQEAAGKVADLRDLDLSWAIIGHLQTNKVKSMARFAKEFHALDSLRLADALQARLASEGRRLEVFVQVNTSNEPSKYGLSPNDAEEFVRHLSNYPALVPRGLMTLSLLSDDKDKIRNCFRLLREMRDGIRAHLTLSGIEKLSMGMTHDFEVAIEEGADVVRIGQAIFGQRPTRDSEYWPGSDQAIARDGEHNAGGVHRW
jgi:PLP dependent protein